MQFSGPFAQMTDFREKAGHWFAAKFGKSLRRRDFTLITILDSFIECGEGFNRVAPGVALIWDKLLQNGLCRRFSILRLVFEEAGNPRNLPKGCFFRQKSAELKVGVFPFFDTTEEFQDEALPINDGAIALLTGQ